MSGDDQNNELGKIVFPPNKPLEVELEFSKTPVIYNHLFYLDFNKNGECILSASNITGTFWEGTLLYFNNPNDMEVLWGHKKHYIYCTTTDGKFVNEKTIALAEDTGMLTILKVNDDELLQPVRFFRTIERISQIAVWDKSQKVLTCSGRSISAFDVNNVDRKPTEKFNNYHLEFINSVDTIKENENIFVSAASDRKAFIWDLRDPYPASVLYTNEFSSLTSVACNQIDTNCIVVGTQAGSIYVLDKRQPKEFVEVVECFESSIHRIAFSDKNKFSVCGASDTVVVIDCSRFDKQNIVGKHNNIVRGMKWYNNVLYTCGFDKRVVKHVDV